MMYPQRRRRVDGALRSALCAACFGLACTSEEIVIGASLPLSGPLASFGSYQKWGYETAVAEINASGGISIGGTKKRVKLSIRDDKTDPNVTASNSETLITRDGAVALLGSCTPALVNAGALVAERRQVPLVSGCSPLQAFKSVRRWKYAWVMFFDEAELARAPFRMLADYGLETNRSIAIMADNGPDGQVVGGQYWPANAQTQNYGIGFSTSFPVDTQHFTSMVAEAKASNAEVVLVDTITPLAIAIRKQMAGSAYTPKLLVMEKGAEPEQFARALGSLADGVLVGGYWDPSFEYPGARELGQRFEAETRETHSQHIADSYTAAQVLLDAITAAGSVDREQINAAIGKTDKSYVIGPVKFDAEHGSTIPTTLMQWQDGKAVVVWPKARANGQLMFPLVAAK